MTDDSIVTDLQRRLARAEADRDRYRAIFDTLDEGFCTIEVIEDEAGRPVDYRFLETNAAFIQQTGLTDAVGQSMKALAPGHETHWFEIYGRIARSRVAERFEDRAEALGRWYDVFALPVDAPEQRRVAVIFHDILKRRLTEIALQESEQRSRALVSASSDVVYRMSPDWQEMRILDGRGFLAATKAPSVRWIDQYLFEEDRPQIFAVIEAAIRDKSVFECEHRVRRADGTAGWTLSRAIPILDADGDILEWFGMAADITQRHQAVEHLRLVANELNHRVKNNLRRSRACAACWPCEADPSLSNQKSIALLARTASVTRGAVTLLMF